MNTSALDDAFTLLRQRWLASLVGDASLDVSDPLIKSRIDTQSREASALREAMLPEPKAPTELWPDLDTAHNSAALTTTTRRLSALAVSYALRGSTLYGSEGLLRDITQGLAWFLKSRYNSEGNVQYDNWWDWQIGVPLHLNTLLACVHEDLPPELVKAATDASMHFTPIITATGANGAWRADILIRRGLLTGNDQALRDARAWISGTMLQYSDPPEDPRKSGFAEGFYRDGSFFAHDRHPYNGGYGRAALTSCAQLVALLAGSPWAVEGPERNHVCRWFFDSYAPLLYKGQMFDSTVGREISRFNLDRSPTGVVNILLALLEAAPEMYQAQLQRCVKGIAAPEMAVGISYSQIAALKALMADPDVKPAPPAVLFKHFPLMARTSLLRPAYGASVSMYSDTLYSYECLNGENLKGWHTSDGWLQIADSDTAQFTDGYWPTVNWHRLPGTTVVQDLEKPANSQNGSNWAGGASADGICGVTGMELKPGIWNHWDSQKQKTVIEPDGQTLTARKSWFLFQDEIVCLGSGIQANDEKPVETIIENRRLAGAGENTLLVNGQPQVTAFGQQEAFPAQWLHLAGNVPGSDLGYLFLEGTQVQALRETRTGSWREINAYHSEARDEVARHYLTLWIEQGVRPAAASYAYTILPGQSATALARYAENPDVVILTNTPAVHAVQQKTLGMVAANFWKDTPTRVPLDGRSWLSSNRKACVMVRRQEGTITLAVSDPTRANTESIMIVLALPSHTVLTKSDYFHVETLSPATVVTLDLSRVTRNEWGQTFTIVLAE